MNGWPQVILAATIGSSEVCKPVSNEPTDIIKLQRICDKARVGSAYLLRSPPKSSELEAGFQPRHTQPPVLSSHAVALHGTLLG